MRRRDFLPASLALLAPLAATLHPRSTAADTPSPASRKFRLGLVTYNLAAGWALPDLLRVCKATGVGPVELRTTHKHGVEPALTKEERREVRQRFADAGVELWGCGTVCEFHSPDPAVVKKHVADCQRFIDLVAELGGRGVKVRPNALPRGEEVATVLARIGRALVTCGKSAADAGVEVWVEVHGPGTSHPPHVKTIMQECGHPKVGITWNSNPTDLKDGSVAEAFKLLRPWLLSCHINELYKDGTGAYPYRELFRLMRETGYDRATLIEVGRPVPDPEAGAEFLRYYKALWTELSNP